MQKQRIIQSFFGKGKYEFWKCVECYEPILANLEQKCPKVEYSEDDVKKFERYIENIGGFQEAIQEREKRLRDEAVKFRVKKLTEVLGEEQIVKMKYIIESKIKESIKILVNSEEEMKLMKEVFKVTRKRREQKWRIGTQRVRLRKSKK